MPHVINLAALAAAVPSVLAAYQGFNYGALKPDGNLKQQVDFENEFRTAQALSGAPGSGFTSARLYTTIQGGTANHPILAIPAAIATNTSLLLGIWCSAGGQTVDNELAALIQAVNQYGDAFTRLVAGISVGSEDLYRNSPTGMANGENPGVNPDILVSYIKKTRDAIAGTKLAGKPVGHVDTWTAWVNGTNGLVTDACDWLGMDAYPYFQSKVSNAIQYNNGLFEDALRQTQSAARGKPVWITETGFPVSGTKSGDAVPSIENAKVYWDQVGCPRFGNVNTWWFTLQDHSGPLTGAISFGIIGGSLTTKPLFDISCGGLPLPGPEPRPNAPPASEPAPPSTTSSAAVVARSNPPSNSSDTETSTDVLSPGATSATGTSSPSNSTVPGFTAMGGSTGASLGVAIAAMVFVVFAV